MNKAMCDLIAWAAFAITALEGVDTDEARALVKSYQAIIDAL